MGDLFNKKTVKPFEDSFNKTKGQNRMRQLLGLEDAEEETEEEKKKRQRRELQAAIIERARSGQ